jgi:hypothetical protein
MRGISGSEAMAERVKKVKVIHMLALIRQVIFGA